MNMLAGRWRPLLQSATTMEDLEQNEGSVSTLEQVEIENLKELNALVTSFRQSIGLRGKRESMSKLITKILPDIKGYIRRRIRPEWMDDVLFDTLYSMGRTWRTFRGRSWMEFKAWCFTITSRRIIDMLRKHRDWEMDIEGVQEEIERQLESEGRPPHEIGPDLEYAMEVLRAAKSRCVRLLTLRYLEGHTFNEMAKILKTTVDTVKGRTETCLSLASRLIASHP